MSFDLFIREYGAGTPAFIAARLVQLAVMAELLATGFTGAARILFNIHLGGIMYSV